MKRSTRSTGGRAAITLVDQGVSSVSNFAVGVVVARLAGPAGLGVFSLAYAAWQLLATQHRSLVTDPMAIEGDANDPQHRRGILEGLAAELLLGCGAALLFAVLGLSLLAAGDRNFAIALLAVALWLPALVVQDYWRWVGFMTGQPSKSLANDLAFDVVQAGAFVAVFLAGDRQPAVVIGAWGLAALAAAGFGIWQHRLIGFPRSAAAALARVREVGGFLAEGAALLRRRWGIGRWIAGNTLLNWGTSQGFLIVASIILGPVGLGSLRAAQQLVTGPSMVVIQAGGSVGLPEASKAYAERGWPGLIKVARVVTGLGAATVGAMTVLVAVAGNVLLSTIYGPQFAHLQGAAVVIGVGQSIQVLAIGSLLVMKVTRNTHYLVYTVSVAFAVSMVAVAVLSHLYGVDGAAWASVATAVVGVVGVRWFHHRSRLAVQRRPQAAQQSRPAAAAASDDAALAEVAAVAEPVAAPEAVAMPDVGAVIGAAAVAEAAAP